MEIQSAFNSGVQGFQKASEDANKAAEDIARSTTHSFEESSQSQEVETSSSGTTSDKEPNLTQSLVDLKVAENQAKSSANVIRTADETLGSILDVTV